MTAFPLMLIVNRHIPAAADLAPSDTAGTRVRLDWDTRCKSRFDARDSADRHIAVILPRGTVLRGGDSLIAEDGSRIVVEAARQPLLRIQIAGTRGEPSDLVRAAYHLGNRHVQLEVEGDFLQIEPDPVLAAMLVRMGLTVTEVAAPFEPEAGAYAPSGHTHSDHGGHPDHDDPGHS